MRIGDIWEEDLEYEIKSHAYQIGVDSVDIVAVCNEMDIKYIAGECQKLSPMPHCYTDSKCPTARFFLYTKAELRVLHHEASEVTLKSNTNIT